MSKASRWMGILIIGLAMTGPVWAAHEHGGAGMKEHGGQEPGGATMSAKADADVLNEAADELEALGREDLAGRLREIAAVHAKEHGGKEHKGS